MARKVPFAKVPGIPPRAQYELQRNFEAAQLAMTEGGRVDVPFAKIAGLPPAAQYQIQRNFEDLMCDCADVIVPGTMLASDTFARNENPMSVTDSYAGGTTRLWNQLNGGIWQANTGLGAAIYATDGAGGVAVDSETVVDTATTDVLVHATLHMPITTTGGTGMGIVARCTGYGNFLFCLTSTNAGVQTLLVGDRIGGVTSLRAASPYAYPGTPFLDHVLSLECIGAQVRCYFNGTQFASFTTALISGTNQGLLGQRALSGAYFLEFRTLTA